MDTNSGTFQDADLEITTHQVDAGSWVGEPCMWVEWVHLGDLQAMGQVEVLTVDGPKFRGAAMTHMGLWDMASSYGGMFVQALNTASIAHLTDLLCANSFPSYFEDLKFDKDNAHRRTKNLGNLF